MQRNEKAGQEKLLQPVKRALEMISDATYVMPVSPYASYPPLASVNWQAPPWKFSDI